MRRSSATAVPVLQDPHPAPVRQAIRDLIRDWVPVELRDIEVFQRDDDWYQVTANTPAGQQAHRDVYL